MINRLHQCLAVPTSWARLAISREAKGFLLELLCDANLDVLKAIQADPKIQPLITELKAANVIVAVNNHLELSVPYHRQERSSAETEELLPKPNNETRKMIVTEFKRRVPGLCKRTPSAQLGIIDKCLRQYKVSEILAAFDTIEASDWLMGRKVEWKATFAWIMTPKNMEKILSGAYEGQATEAGSNSTTDLFAR